MKEESTGIGLTSRESICHLEPIGENHNGVLLRFLGITDTAKCAELCDLVTF